MTGHEDPPLQPFLESEIVVLHAPVQAWSAPSGEMGGKPIHGIYISDTRVLSGLEVRFDDRPVETIATVPLGADASDFVGVVRHLDDPSPDPHVRVIHRRVVAATGVTETIRLESLLEHEIETTVRVILIADATGMETIKGGLSGGVPRPTATEGGAGWSLGPISARVSADVPTVIEGARVVMEGNLTVPAHGEVAFGWRTDLSDTSGVVAPATAPTSWTPPDPSGNDRLDRWVTRAVADLDALRMTTTADPSAEFVAAGAPWFFTLFGRDSLWAARFLHPLGGTLTSGTLRVLAGLQGTADDPATAEQPGKIMHELRRAPLAVVSDGVVLPPLYYGTIDATALWVCLLCDAADGGMPTQELETMRPHLEAALAWMRDFGDADGDGLLEYVDVGGLGLANQGWKDSRDSVQWRTGELATAPIALCEVQGYAFEAATRGADLLDRLGSDGSPWRQWADRLRQAFNDRFWIDDAAGAYPAIALDAEKRAVDSLTSNIGHLLGTGILDETQSELVARRLVSPELNSGYGLRTMATSSAGYWPLSYHGGSVWAHDTAIAIRGLALAGFRDEAVLLADGLLAAATSFDYRMPELHSGDPAADFSRPVPYPAACRPQAWSAAAAIAVHAVLTGVADQ